MLPRSLLLTLIFVLSPAALCGSALAQPFSENQLTTAQRLMDQALESDLGYEIVESLTTEVGPRLAGTEAESRARDWAIAMLKAQGFENVRNEPFPVPLWVRGVETAAITSPYPQPLAITALGGSSSTGPDGVEAEIVAFKDLASVEALPDGSLKGKIIFIDEPMTRTQDGSGYGVAVRKRRTTAYEGVRLGAVAALIRSVGTSTHRFAHTGQMQRLTEGEREGVPTAALSAPDADQLTRSLERGQPVRVKMVLTPETLPPSESGNVMGEIVGSEKPEEIILVGAHLDSWDLGTGAVDDGAGVGIVTAAARLVAAENPKRTIRVVLFGAEEVGLVGAKAYAEQHWDDLDNHILAAESDFGAGHIWRFETRVHESKLETAQAIGNAMRGIGVGPGPNTAYGGPDLTYVRAAGVPVVTLKQDGLDYFDLHHTPNDTFDKIDPADMAQNVAAYAAFIYLASEVDAHFRGDEE